MPQEVNTTDAFQDIFEVLSKMNAAQEAFHIVMIDMLAKDDDHYKRMIDR